MSDKVSEMYKWDRSVGLVTEASSITQNLALLDIDEYLTADSLAVIHAGYINYIPIINPLRRSKYVAINTGNKRGIGCILNIKWLKIVYETFLVVLSSEGILIYDAEVTEVLYNFKTQANINSKGIPDVIPLGMAVIKQFLCVGLSDGFVHLFKPNEEHSFEHIHRVEVGEFLLCDGINKNLVLAARQGIYMWEFSNCLFFHRTELNSERMNSVPSVLKVVSELAIVGYENGDLGVYSLERHKTLSKCQSHKARITGIDFSHLKTMIITSSLDRFIKVWQYNFTHSSINSIFCLETNYELCGVGFLNLRCTEFCVVKCANIQVDIFVKVDSDYD